MQNKVSGGQNDCLSFKLKWQDVAKCLECWYFAQNLSITLIAETCKFGKGGESNGPATLPNATSCASVSDTTLGFWYAEGRFLKYGGLVGQCNLS